MDIRTYYRQKDKKTLLFEETKREGVCLPFLSFMS